jgi:hypothetical protein
MAILLVDKFPVLWTPKAHYHSHWFLSHLDSIQPDFPSIRMGTQLSAIILPENFWVQESKFKAKM